ncbi:hypothetical protein ACFX1S_044046 [Malus domestica]
MVATSSVDPASHANLDTFSNSPMVGVCLASRTHMLNRCIVWLENNHDVTNELPKPSDPSRPYTRIHPWSFDFGSRFPLSLFLNEILIFYQIGLCNLTPSSIRIVTCFEHLDNWYRAELGLLVFLTLYTMQRSIELDTTFSPDLISGGLPTSPICPGRTKISASKHEKKKMKKSEEVIPKAVHIKTSNKRTKLMSSSAKEGFYQPLITGGEEGENTLSRELGALLENF